ncbi:MAG: hypothetical protein NTU44_11935 [Bacteroidetes bacterium]|nr:hypothetical protein [Bacteroidota bacterium]
MTFHLLRSFLLLALLWPGLPEAFSAPPHNPVLVGYSSDISGEILAYHSCHAEATSSLLIRCLNDKDQIEWATEEIPSSALEDTLTFCWIGGFSTGTSTASHRFTLFLDDLETLSFQTIPSMKEEGWRVPGKEGISLEFMFISEDHVKDQFGYFFLRIPKNSQPLGKSLKIKVKGDATGSRDWYMTMRYSIHQRVKLLPEEAIIRGKNNMPYQRLKLSIDHFGEPEQLTVELEGDPVCHTRLVFGSNDLVIPVKPAAKEETRVVELKGISHQQKLSFTLAPVREFKVYLLPHSHVDIGYTNLQTEIANLHARHVANALKLIRETAGFPENSRFKWNVEMLWEAEAFLQRANPAQRKEFIDLVKKGDVDIMGLYAGVLTGLCRDEELFHLFDKKNELENQYGMLAPSAMITDVPGYSWGLINAMARNNIKYFSIGPNSGDRVGNVFYWGDKPFYWETPSGNEKVLCWVSGKGYSLFHRGSLAKTDGSPVLDYLSELKARDYPYDMVQLRYTVGGDNGYPDSLLPAYVRDWNERYISPVLIISTTTGLFKNFENKYGTQLPVNRGDLSPYWEDGAGSSAAETGLNRRSAEKTIQAATTWSMLFPAETPSTEIKDAWNNILLYSEHTWGAWNSISDPDLSFVKDQWQIKKSFAEAGYLISNFLIEKIAFKLNKDQSKNNFITVINTNSWKRSGMVYLLNTKVPEGMTDLVDDQGYHYPGQRLNNGKIVYYLNGIPPVGMKKYRFAATSKTKQFDFRITPSGMENKLLRVGIDTVSGEIISLMDKKTGREWVNNSHSFGLNTFFYSGSNAADPQKSGKTTTKISELGPVMATLEITSIAPGCDRIVREISLNHSDNRLFISDHVVKRPVRKKENVRFAFPFSMENPEIRMDMAWFTLEPGKNQLPGSNMNYYTVQRWLDVSGQKDGIALATQDAPLWEMGSMTAEKWLNNEIPGWMKVPEISPLLFSWVMNNSWETNYKADQDGEIVFDYALMPHGKFNPVDDYRFGIEISQPLQAFIGEYTSASPLPLLNENENIALVSINPGRGNEQEVLYRFYNISDKRLKYKPFSDLSKGREMMECDPNGKALGEASPELIFNPFEVKTVKVKYLLPSR